MENWDQPHSVSRLATNLNQLFLCILEAFSEQQVHETPNLTSRQRTVELFLNEVESNQATASEPWTINGMAEHCNMGVTAFSKYCRELVNAGPMKYLNQCRLDHAAKQLLENKGRSVTDIAMDCGFNSSQYFATRFRQRFHVSPREYIWSGNPGFK